MIEIKQLTVVFNKGEVTETTALSELSLSIAAGEFVVVIGSNGSGKTTLLNSIAGTVLPEAGTITISDTDITLRPDYERAQYISRIFQNPLTGTASELSILENFRLAALRTKKKGLTIGTGKAFENKVKENISFLKLGLENNIYKPMGSLSGGQRQSLTLIMGIMDECKIILLDEPTAALDPRSSELVMEKAAEIINTYKLTALLVTHHMKDALKYGSRLIMMEEGRIIKNLQSDEKGLLKMEDLVKWFD